MIHKRRENEIIYVNIVSTLSVCNLGNSDGVSGYIKIRENSFKHPMHRECAKNIPTYFSD